MNCELDVNECMPSPCVNGARCEDRPADYICYCVPGFTGKNCQTQIDECQSGSCKNGATCNDFVNG